MVRLLQGTYSWTCLAADSAAGETKNHNKLTLSGRQRREKRFPCAGDTVGAHFKKLCVLQNIANCAKMVIFEQVKQRTNKIDEKPFYHVLSCSLHLASYLEHAKWIKNKQRIDRSLAGAHLA